jgi:hypothetical protein
MADLPRINPTKVRPFRKIKILKFDNNEIPCGPSMMDCPETGNFLLIEKSGNLPETSVIDGPHGMFRFSH